VVIAHNDPSPTRDRVLRAYERRRRRSIFKISLPSLDGIKRPWRWASVSRSAAPLRADRDRARASRAVKVPELGASASGAARVREDRRTEPRGRNVSFEVVKTS
jgi:hypothetical protein